MNLCEWNINNVVENKDEINLLAKEFKINFLCAAILFGRGIRDIKKANLILNFEDNISLPMSWTGMKNFVDKLIESINSNEKICIYGDYDADGVTATALMYEYLKSKNADVIYYIPERDRDGYGLNKNSVKYLKDLNVDVILTVDNGISAYDEIEYAHSLGMKVYVTDHHRLPETLPNADAMINPHLNQGDDKATNFAGVGVAFKLVSAMEKDNKLFDFDKFIDLVVIGTIGDAVELLGETKNIMNRGLEKFAASKRYGISVILDMLNIKNRELNMYDIGFRIVPRINACGRMNNAELALKLLISDSYEESKEIFDEVEKYNASRKEIEKSILEDIEFRFKECPEHLTKKIIVMFGSGWHHGVLGIVASRLVEKYGKPCILITQEGDISRGSCRSLEGFSIYNLLVSCVDLLERFGGHHMAAGFDIKTSNIYEFVECINKKSENLEIPMKKLNIDFCLSKSDISLSLLDSLSALKPFGSGNSEPIFGIMGVKIVSLKSIGCDRHIRIEVMKDDYIFSIFYFNKSIFEFLYQVGEVVDLAVKVSKNDFKGIISVTTRVIDIKLSSANIKTAIRQKTIYNNFKAGLMVNRSDAKSLEVKRDDLIKIYKYYKSAQNMLLRPDVVSERVFGNCDNTAIVSAVNDILSELGIISLFDMDWEYIIKINQIGGKVNLANSSVLQRIKEILKCGDS